ncbi:YceI family protein [Rhabdothermincola sediminis]|uniref:YceI family protein n=1 Tax=Rhabdothermincola sediminis TaxID=2751370 RepID=UPI001AA06947|nr:YceI family protein [Rhabdothermincola sediminis]
MQKSAKYALIACLAVVLLGGFAFWWFVLRSDAPERASVPVRTESTVPTDPTDPGGASSPDGTWRIAPADDVFAGYRIQELFAGETIKNTAVGRTPAVTGTMTIVGGSVAEASIEADLTKLASDQSRRDSFIRGNALQTDAFPTATFRLSEPIALPSGIAVGRSVEVTAVGELTLHGVTNRVELPLRATWNGSTISVAGGTQVILADYGIDPPRLPIVTTDDVGELEVQLVFERV